VKVPIEDAEEKNVSAEAEAAAENEAAMENEATTEDAGILGDELDPEEEAARVEAAKRAGEAAAEEDFKAQANKATAEKDEIAAKLEDAERRAEDAKERLVRLQADWENYRRRTAQERLDEKQRAAEKLVLNLLPVLDDMERASDHAAQNHADDENLMQFVDGVNAVHDKMLSVLAKEGVEVIDPAGEAFDPLHHQAVGREENKDVFDETVAQVYQKGYSMGGKTIRSAMVTVAFGGPKRPAPAEEPEDAEGADSSQTETDAE
jgi:molecular chaperone GrpE